MPELPICTYIYISRCYRDPSGWFHRKIEKRTETKISILRSPVGWREQRVCVDTYEDCISFEGCGLIALIDHAWSSITSCLHLFQFCIVNSYNAKMNVFLECFEIWSWNERECYHVSLSFLKMTSDNWNCDYTLPVTVVFFKMQYLEFGLESRIFTENETDTHIFGKLSNKRLNFQIK